MAINYLFHHGGKETWEKIDQQVVGMGIESLSHETLILDDSIAQSPNDSIVVNSSCARFFPPESGLRGVEGQSLPAMIPRHRWDFRVS